MKNKLILWDERWYNHQPKTKTETKEANIVWGFATQTKRKIKSNGPDIVVKDYKKKCFLINRNWKKKYGTLKVPKRQ